MRHVVREYDLEPTPGLPELLPAGETILWRGSPTWWGIATTVCHIRVIALYFAGLMVWSVWSSLADGLPVSTAIAGAFRYLPIVAGLGLGLLAAIALLISRTSVYTITDRRVVIRFGMAMPMAVNLPFTKIDRAAVGRGENGAGDIALGTLPGEEISSLFLWPHVRPLRIVRPEPTLRSVPDVTRVGAILSDALVAFAARPADAPAIVPAVAAPVRVSALAAILRSGVEARRKPVKPAPSKSNGAEPPTAMSA